MKIGCSCLKHKHLSFIYCNIEEKKTGLIILNKIPLKLHFVDILSDPLFI